MSLFFKLLFFGFLFLSPFLSADSVDSEAQLRMALSADPSLLNPILSTDLVSSTVEDLIFDSLLKIDKKLEIKPHLVRAWKYSKDGLIWDFYLRNDVKWADGKPLTTADVQFTFEKMTHPQTRTVRRAAFFIEGQPIRLKVIDAYHFQAILPKPYAPFLSSMAFSVLPKHLYLNQEIHTTALNRKPMGSGPFQLKEWKSGAYLLLERNENYFLGKPLLKQILFKVMPETTTQLMALQTGELDLASIPPKDYERFKSFNFLKIYNYDQLFYSYLGFNLKGIFSERKLRLAIAHAIDKKSILRSVYKNKGSLAYSPASPVSWSYEKDVAHFDFDPQKTKTYLKELGYELKNGFYEKNGKKLKFELLLAQGSRDGEKVALIVQQYLKNVGIDMQIRSLEWTALLKIVNGPAPKTFDAVMLSWSLGVDPDSYYLWHSSQYPQGFNFVGYSNLDVDRLSVQGREVLDQNSRKKIYSQIQKQIAMDQPYYFLIYPKSMTAVRNTVEGYDTNPGPAGLFLEMHKVFKRR